ncbi:MAG: helix-hairpin-helix domain-containing protein [Lachnospiraceae bacterium]|nr:helix-hairpin-helix domain-containing protein [Lachnospiraceae bacterium]
MDKNRKKKTVLAVCFVLVCGVACLWIHYGSQREEQIVLEKQGESESLQTPEMLQDKAAEESDCVDVTETPKELYIHVCGAVVTEGLYVLPAGSRLADGIAAAGGFAATADTAYHNLAAGLSDGQKIYVPTLEETEGLSVSERGESTGMGETVSEVLSSGQEGKVNLNTAGKDELMSLPGIGEEKAERILQYREKVGSFQKIEEIKNVSGIGEAIFERIKGTITAE